MSITLPKLVVPNSARSQQVSTSAASQQCTGDGHEKGWTPVPCWSKKAGFNMFAVSCQHFHKVFSHFESYQELTVL